MAAVPPLCPSAKLYPMTTLVEKALEAITKRTNLSTGIDHPNDKNAAKEMFNRLHVAGEILLAEELSSWASSHGWKTKDAAKLGALGQQIGMGKQAKVYDGPWWREEILDILLED